MGEHMSDIVPAFIATAVLSIMLGTGSAPAQDRTWIFSGSELKQAIEGKFAPEASDPELRRTISVAKSSAYIAGVADATASKQWCGAGVAPHELTDRVYTYLVDAPSETLSQAAAALVEKALASSFPCEPKKN